MSASAEVLELFPAPDSAVIVRAFLSFLPIPDEARRVCGLCGASAEGPPEPVGNWGLVAFTCRPCRLFDRESDTEDR